jgi:lipopolysaccharide/colanic/teichoic acid biosynthesis glycosyltransferase
MKKIIKRIIDIVLSSVAIIILSPFLVIIAILIKSDSKGPVFFIQERVGQDGKPFNFFKFRTMIDNAEKIGLKEGASEDDPRITKIGKFLREWTIDESPQFVNILKGDMSLVGPRPLSAYNSGTTPEMEKLWQKRITIKPGLVSIVDIKGRNLVPWQKRFEYDAWYIDHQSLWLDLKILVLGFFAVLGRKGVYGEGGTNKTNS